MDQYSLSLTHREAMLLSDRVPPSDDTYRLLLQIASALLETKTAVEASMVVSLADLWVMRNSVNTAMMVGPDPTGYTVILKVSAGLLELSSAMALSEVGLPNSDRDEPSKQEVGNG